MVAERQEYTFKDTQCSFLLNSPICLICLAEWLSTDLQERSYIIWAGGMIGKWLPRGSFPDLVGLNQDRKSFWEQSKSTGCHPSELSTQLRVLILPLNFEIWHLPLSTLESRSLLEVNNSYENLKATPHPKDTQTQELCAHIETHLMELIVLYLLPRGVSAFHSLSIQCVNQQHSFYPGLVCLYHYERMKE